MGNRGKGHGTLALVMGIASVAVALFVGIMFGMYGIVPAMILAAGAIIIGIMSLKSTGGRTGKGGLIIGIIALLITIIIGAVTVALGEFLKSDEIKTNVPTLSAYADESWRGIAGLMIKMNSDGVDMDQLVEEINAFSSGENGTVMTETAMTEAAK